jgi:predicted AAA+ superfamily ATPase
LKVRVAWFDLTERVFWCINNAMIISVGDDSKIILITGGSCSGKTTFLKLLQKQNPDIKAIMKYVERKPRANEIIQNKTDEYGRQIADEESIAFVDSLPKDCD